MKTPLNKAETIALSVTRGIGSIWSVIVHTLLFGGAFALNFYKLTVKGNFGVTSGEQFIEGVSTVIFENKDPLLLETITISGNVNFYSLVLNVNGHVNINSQIVCLAKLDYIKGYIDNGDLILKGNIL